MPNPGMRPLALTSSVKDGRGAGGQGGRAEGGLGGWAEGVAQPGVQHFTPPKYDITSPRLTSVTLWKMHTPLGHTSNRQKK